MSASINPPPTKAYLFYRNWLLIYAREQKGWSLSRLASKSGITESVLSAIEDGSGKLSYDQAGTLGKLLHISPHYLFMTSIQLVNLRLCSRLFHKERERMEQEMLEANYPQTTA